MTATVIQPTNHARDCRVIPLEMVSAVRPPGMKRAVINSSPPRSAICSCAHSRRLRVLALRAARRSNHGPACAPIW